MLDIATKFLSVELNSYIVRRTGISPDEKPVNPSAIVDHAGKYDIADDSIGVSIINLEEETTVKSQRLQYVPVNGEHIVMEPDMRLNLYVLFAANFRVYEQSLKFISYVMTFFQSHPSFRSQQFPSLDPRIEKLTAELQSLNYEQLNQIWAYIGGKYLPSVVYKLRMLVVQDPASVGLQPPVHEIDPQLLRK